MQRQQFYEEVKTFEGFSDNMYLDSKGYVTIGIGILLDSADKAVSGNFNFVNKKTGKTATPDEIKEEWKNVKKLHKGRGLSYYNEATKLTADEALLNSKFESLMLNALYDAKKYYPDFDNLPSNIQFALWDMSYNLGYPKLSQYQRLKKHLEEGDYKKAAKECKRNGTGERRNRAIEKWIEDSATVGDFNLTEGNTAIV